MSEDLADTRETEPADAAESAPEVDGHPPIAEASDQTVEIGGLDHFESLIDTHDVVIAQVYGEWCDICDMMQPLIEDLATREGLIVATINIEKNEPLGRAMGVQKIPTFTLYIEGEPIEQAAGAHDREWFDELLADYI